MAEPIIRWGILGTGTIARLFAAGLAHVADARLVAVGSRSAASADRFAGEFGIPRRHPSAEALAADPGVDIVYIASPHVAHREQSLLCLRAGKAVLCEKPFTLNAAEAAEVIACARQEGRFLMEAMWTRFYPTMETLRRLLDEGAIGELRALSASIGFPADVDAGHRLLNPALGGGALLDTGVYPVSFASMLWGAPREMGCVAEFGPSGVDEQISLVFDHGEGRQTLLLASLRADTPVEAVLMGTGGCIRVHRHWYKPTQLSVLPSRGEARHLEAPLQGNGFNYEASAVTACLQQGLLEHPLMPLDETLAIMQTMDRIRARIGLRYPGEPASQGDYPGS